MITNQKSGNIEKESCTGLDMIQECLVKNKLKSNNYIYIASFVDEVSTTDNADVIIIVGHPFFSGSEPFTFGDEIIADGRAITRVYGGIVKSGPYFDNSYQSSNKPQVLAYGNRIEGDIAAVKRMINARNIFLNKDAYDKFYEVYIDDYDTLGISVMDLMHNSESETYFTQNNEGFTNVVKKILFDNNFEVAVKPVKPLVIFQSIQND